MSIEYFVLHHLGGHTPSSRASFERASIADGYRTIPYNYYVMPDGTVVQSRPHGDNAANLGINSRSLSICIIGNFDEAANPNGAAGLMEPTVAQLYAAGQLVKRLVSQYPKAKLIQHKDVVKLVPLALYNGRWVSTATACPGSRSVKLQMAGVIWLLACGFTLEAARRKLGAPTTTRAKSA